MKDSGTKSKPHRGRSRERVGFVRLADVAELAQVSTATVSRTFNEPHKVSSKIREQVLVAAKELNWIPNAAGKALASSRTHIAGAVIPTLDNEIFARQVGGIQSVMSEHGFTLLLGCSNYDLKQAQCQIKAMLARGVEAVAIAGEDQLPSLFDALKTHNVPYVVTYSFSKDMPHTYIGFNNRKAFCCITQYLLKLGHKKFGAIFQPMEHNDRATARLSGVRDTLFSRGLHLKPEKLFWGPPTLEFGAESFRCLMAKRDETTPTAIICGNDNLALGALLAAQEMGLSAPNDFSITGFDDLSISSLFSPKLTTMKIDNQQIGVLAGKALLAAINGDSEQSSSIELQPEFKIRNSTGPAPCF